MTDHAASADHGLAVAAENPGQKKVAAVSQAEANKYKYNKRQVEAAIAGLKTAHFVAMEEIPCNKFKSLQGWGRHMGVTELKHLRGGKNATHDSPEIFNEVCFA